ncbi:MAG TPA: hypothetical protein PK957_00245 [Candidatus Dojkabacteria bacterium]|nr:hypothetical protein [Candidatus Dojkabacteria bacterium]HQF36632.1 hypothetical protein [Candidatus Dojkabacteria bacterium]
MEEKEVSPSPTTSTKKLNTLLIVIIAVVLLCGCCIVSGVAGYFLYKGKSDKPVFLDGKFIHP